MRISISLLLLAFLQLIVAQNAVTFNVNMNQYTGSLTNVNNNDSFSGSGEFSSAAAPGCTDPDASNYDPLADEDDGSCLYLCDAADQLTVTTNTAFDDGSGNSFGSASEMGLLAGGNNVFGGHLWNVTTAGLTISEFCISIDYNVTGDPADFPRILEFRIENNGTSDWHHFNTEVPGPGTYTLGGIVSTGTPSGAGFNPDGAAPSLVAAIAFFPGDATTLVGDVIVEFSNLCVTTDCGGGALGCTDPGANNYNPDATTDDGSCLYDVTFNVDMNCFDGNDPDIEFEGDGTFTTPAVEGPGFGWCGSCVPMEDPDLDGIWSVTVELGAGLFEYKYAHDFFAGQEQLVDDMAGGADCAPVTDFVAYANRQVLVGPGAETNDTYGSCESCNPDALEEFIQVDLDIIPNPSSGEIQLKLAPELRNMDGLVTIYSLSGKTLFTRTLQSMSDQRLDLSWLSEGIYLIEIRSDEFRSIERLMIQN